jgi:hypothetical protein
VTFEGDMLASERICWDQASVLIQIGLLDPAQIAGCGRGNGAEGARNRPLPSKGVDSAVAGERGEGLVGGAAWSGGGSP